MFNRLNKIDILIFGSIAYLLIPNLIFIIGWIKPLIAIPLSGLAIYSGYKFSIRLRICLINSKLDLNVSKLSIFLIISINLILLLLAGIGGFMKFQTLDWLWRYPILYDLLYFDWPVFHNYNNNSIPLVYYMAYFLPSGLVGLLSSWTIANYCLLIWSLIGLSLACLWVVLFLGKNAVWMSLLFLFFSGLDGLAVLVKILIFSVDTAANIPNFLGIFQSEIIKQSIDHLEWWAEFGTYHSNITHVFWAPNQALAGWIATGSFYAYLKYSKTRSEILFPLAFLLLYSPFVFIGLVFYLLYDLVINLNLYINNIKNIISRSNFASLIVISIISLYFLSTFTIAPLFEGDPGIELGLSPFLYLKGPKVFVWKYLLLVSIEVIVFYLLIRFISKQPLSKLENKELKFIIILLILIPLFKIGVNNDFMMRSSIPAFFILFIYFGKSISNLNGIRLAIFSIIVSLSLLNPFVELSRSIQTNFVHDKDSYKWMYQSAKNVEIVWTIDEQLDSKIGLVSQYLGEKNSIFFRYIAKKNRNIDSK